MYVPALSPTLSCVVSFVGGFAECLSVGFLLGIPTTSLLVMEKWHELSFRADQYVVEISWRCETWSLFVLTIDIGVSSGHGLSSLSKHIM